MYNSQSGQDQFVLNVIKHKENNYFLEIGSNDPININNSYVLEKSYNWNGLMVEYDSIWEKEYIKHRKSKYIINDATKIDYLKFFKENNFPTNLGYLQIDLEVSNGSTIQTLELLNSTIFPEYKFATVTFEHDIYRGNYLNTRERSREIFEKHGYIRVFSDVKNMNNPFEDWYVYPDLVNMDYVNQIKTDNSIEYTNIIELMNILK